MPWEALTSAPLAVFTALPLNLALALVGVVLVLFARYVYVPVAGLIAFASGVPGGLFLSALAGRWVPAAHMSWVTVLLVVLSGLMAVATWYRVERLLVFVAAALAGWLIATVAVGVGLFALEPPQFIAAVVVGVVGVIVHRRARWLFATALGAVALTSGLAVMTGNSFGPFPAPRFLVIGSGVSFVAGVMFQSFVLGRAKAGRGSVGERSPRSSKPTRSQRTAPSGRDEPMTFQPVTSNDSSWRIVR